MLVFALLSVTVPCSAQSARDYYDELYSVGGLDQTAAQYACFDDRPAVKSFFVFSESRIVRDLLIQNGKFFSLPAKERAELDMSFLTYRAYERGVPLYDELFLAKDVDSWVTKAGFYMNTPLTSKLRLTVQWQTLRYEQTIAVLNPDSTLKTTSSTFGRCGRIPIGTDQHGN
jgi:hypothetical protein